MPATKLTKAEFIECAAAICATSKANALALELTRATAKYSGVIGALAEHDPVLAELVADADFAAIEPLNRIVRYLAHKVEN